MLKLFRALRLLGFLFLHCIIRLGLFTALFTTLFKIEQMNQMRYIFLEKYLSNIKEFLPNNINK